MYFIIIIIIVVDEKLYSRQLYVMGHDAQRRMMASRVLLIGMSGLGVEVAKNCVLAGISSLTVLDPTPTTWEDLGGNFYLSPDDIGKPRAARCIDKLAQLNPHVQVKLLGSSSSSSVLDTNTLSQETILPLISTMTCVVITIPLPQKLLTQINDKCRQFNASFIYSLSTGVFGQVFCDFGEQFVVTDKDGNPPASSQVETILPANPALVKVLEDHGRHGLETGDVITFSRLDGNSTTIQQGRDYEVNVTGPYTFELVGVDTSNEKEAATQGYITQVKKPVTLSFETYLKSLETPGELLMSDFAKFDRPRLLHLAYKALAQYWEQHNNSYQTPGDVSAANQVLEIAKSMDKHGLLEKSSQNQRIVLHLASGAKAVLSPMCAALGGIVGQEVLKACSAKFTPIPGFLYLDADECLTDSFLPLDEVAPLKCRYDSQIAVFGKAAQEKLFRLQYFIVGAGAIGCEMLKNWALMGVGCGEDGHVHVTDMDRIEKSNLSRQFLFRNTDINEFKSTTAVKAVQAMNPSLKITAYQEKVAPDTVCVL
jgi:ubiquitin-activating enzyme E1